MLLNWKDVEVFRQNGSNLRREPLGDPPFLIDSSRDENPHDQICTSDKSDEDVVVDENQKEHAGVYLLSILLARFCFVPTFFGIWSHMEN